MTTLWIFLGVFLAILLVWTLVLLALYKCTIQMYGFAGRVLSVIEISDIFLKAVSIAEYEYRISNDHSGEAILKKEEHKRLIVTDVLLQHGYNPRDFNIEGLMSWANDEYSKKRG